VTKNVPPEKIEEAFRAGERNFAENRVQEFLGKKSRLPSEIRWHFVGHLQTNKVKALLGEVVLLHSLDRIELACEIQKQAERRNLRVDTLLQVNTTAEARKSGFAPEKMEEALREIQGFSRIQIRGLMTLGPTPPPDEPQGVRPPNESEIRTSFRNLRFLRNTLKERFPDADLRHLSMGMSADFEIAVEEGATVLRIGSAVFGERQNGRRP